MSFKIFFLFLSVVANAAEVEHISAKQVLENMTLTYNRVEYMKSHFKKTTKSMLLGTEEKMKGTLEYSKNKFRLEFKEKIRSVLIKGEKTFWHINGKNVVTGDVKKAIPSIFEAIFSDVKVWSKLQSSYVSVPQKNAEIRIDPKGTIPNVLEMILVIDLKKKVLIKLSYMDDVNNSINFEFKNTKFFSKAKPKRFVYKAKKNDKTNTMNF